MDQFYRYKMPKLIAKVEGKGNGIKTVIVNMVEVSKSLCRPPTYPTKYFGCELGAQTQWDHKNERYIVNGAHDCSKLAELLNGFIRKFVLCQNCDNPETDLLVSAKRGIISQKCNACGHVGAVDMRHKLTTFIIKNPPDMDPTYASTPSKKDRKSAGGKRKDKGRNSPEANQQENGGGAADADIVLDSPPASNGTGGGGGGVEEEDDADWGDIKPEDIMANMDLTAAAKNLTMDDDLEKSSGERLELFFDFVKKRKEENGLNDKEIAAEAERLEVKDKAVMVLVELLLSENVLKDKELEKYRILFLRFTHDNAKSQKYLLGGFEQLVGVKYHDLLIPKVPMILKSLYDLDIVEEEVIIDWGSKVSKKYVSKQVAQEIHDKAAPLLKWLQEAEEEEEEESDGEEEDEGEDGLQVVYSKTASNQVKTETIKVAAPAPTKPAPVSDDDDDLDIDDI